MRSSVVRGNILFFLSLIIGVLLACFLLLSTTWLVAGSAPVAEQKPLLVLELSTIPKPIQKVPPLPIKKPVTPKPKPRPKPKPKPKPKEKKTVPIAPEPAIIEPAKPQPIAPPIIEEPQPKIEQDVAIESPPPIQKNVTEELEPEQQLLPTPIPIFQLTQVPQFIHREQPIYPPTMRADGITGLVKVEALIDKEGIVRTVKIIKSASEAFDQAAKEAILSSSFQPAKVDDKAVAVLLRIPVEFKLQ